ncbi:MAG TPA: PqiC family protein [Alphaproteobacteria bacterium]|nr:PqiC family protein [Alphaproteobacteria bacterium]
MRNGVRLKTVLALAMAFLLVGCIAPTKPSRFYVLSAVEPPTERTPNGISVSVGPVAVPKYLDRPEIVTRPTANALDLAQYDRWGGRLEDNVLQVLAEDLSRRLKTSRVSTFPAEAATGADVRVSVTVTSFECVGGDNCVLDARWRLSDANGNRPPVVRTFHTEVKAAGASYGDKVAAMSRTLNDLAVTVADAIEKRGVVRAGR